MFNAPRATQRYSTNNSFGSGSFTAEGPLSSSAYDGLDPWSSAPTPDLPPPAVAQPPPSPFTSVIADANVPSIYERAFSAADSAGTGEVSLNTLSRILSTSGLSASSLDRIVNLVSSRPRVSKLEFFVALALVALSQADKDVSIEQVASLASQNALPVPTLDLTAFAPTTSSISPPIYRRENNNITAPSPLRASQQPTFSSDDPWSLPSGGLIGSAPTNGAPSSVSGTGLPREWWRRQEKVQIRLLGMQGFILNRYYVYEITTERGNPVSRRYSEFVFLWDCLVRRYPFRILPQLPPKRIGPDEYFLEQRRRGLVRFLNFVVNHPVIKEDGVLAVFLSEPSLEQWRKHNSVSLDEESASKRVDSVQEMAIPSDLEDKLSVVRGKIGTLIEQWQKICILAERIIKRREAAAVRNPHAPFKRSFLSAYFNPSVSPPPSNAASRSNASLAGFPPSPNSLASSTLAPSMTGSLHGSSYVGSSSAPPLTSDTMSASFFGSLHLPTAPLVGSHRPDGSADGGFFTSHFENPQADLSRLTLTLNALGEANARCWRGDECELCSGVRSGLDQVSNHLSRQAEEVDQRSRHMSSTTLEALKTQRDLYIATRDLFIRQDRLSGDPVERLKKRIESNQMRLEGIRGAQKEGWEVEVDKLAAGIERDQASITTFLQRRIFIRYSMWHELRVVLHNRENSLVTQLVRDFAKEEAAFSEAIAGNWASLVDAVENMPYE